jgi:ABC-type multidrug transport system ATPase subunit
LGQNGAGKTTTLQIITNQIYKTSGEAFVNSQEIGKFGDVTASLGFCPQFDCLPEFLTVYQTLHLFANLRGISKKTTSVVVNEFLRVFKLEEFRNKLVQNLSGGTKRKVSSAIAFIGHPKIVILDEVCFSLDLLNQINKKI